MTDEIKKSKLELITNLLKVILWPFVVIIVIIVFWKPIKNLITNSESISVGSLSLKIKNEIPSPSTQVKKVISNLSGKGVQELLYIGNDTTEFNTYDEGSLKDAPIDELINDGLIKKAIHPVDTIATHNHYKATSLGANTYDFYMNLINVVAKNISQPADNKN